MGTRDPRVDAYIAKAAPFAQPILEHLRGLVHRGDPAITETIKWGMPSFEHGGIVCHMAAFKAHVAFGFWRAGLVGSTGREQEAMGQFGRIATLDDLPADRTVVALVKKAAALNEKGAPKATKPKRPKPELPVPKDLAAALRKNAKARKTFEGFPPSHRREYVEWITEAKTDATRARRLATTLEWLAEGKPRNWKYRQSKA
ncbi:MAG TPA: YdeI/OmpD-associated family protein [Thermoanaerobaculia bacterium]|nr:YdeI/OmpD-associated family protein [Thermoanaerobaculia bacterium]